MNKFSIKRFALVLRRDLSGNRKSYLRYFGLFAIATLLVEFLVMIDYIIKAFQGCEGLEIPRTTYFGLAVTGLSIFYCYALVGLGFFFSCLNTKAKRSSYLMMPATQNEKFLSRLLICSIVWWMGGLIAFELADITRWALCTLLGISNELLMPHLIGRLVSESNTWDFLAISIFLALAPSSYLLGSSFFKKNSVLLTTLCMVALGTVFISVAESVFPYAASTIKYETYREAEHAFFTKFYAACFFFLWSALNSVWAYHRFRRTQVISRSWF